MAIRRLLKYSWPILSFPALAGFYATQIEPRRVEIRRLDLPIPDLADPFVGYSLVQISDIHADSSMTRVHLGKHIDRINALKPDMVVITGDFVTHRVDCDMLALAQHLKGLRATDGIYAIPGNHDYKTPGVIDDIMQLMDDCSITHLVNRVHTVHKDGAALHIAGIDDIDRGLPRIDLILQQLAADQHPAILLAHEPDFADISGPTGRFAVQLSGHAHGGQIRIPSPIFRRLAQPVYGRKYISGFHEVKGMTLYANRGLGMVGIRARFRSRPEITHFTLKKSDALNDQQV